MRRIVLIVATLTIAVAATSPFAQQGPSGIVGARMNVMSDMGRLLKSIQTGRSSADQMDLLLKAENLLQHASTLAGTFETEEYGQGSEAKPLIWQDWAGFEQHATELTTAAEQLVAAIDDDNSSDIRSALRAVQRACGACHAVYRIEADK